MIETRVYLVDVENYEFDTSPSTWDDEKFINEAEIQGNVYSKENFENECNNDNISPYSFIRIISKLSISSENIILGVHERFKELESYQFDWRSFYHGWLEGRTDFCYGYIREQQKQRQ